MSTLKKIAALLICLTMLASILTSCLEGTQDLWEIQDEQSEKGNNNSFWGANDTKKDGSTTKPNNPSSNNNSTAKPNNTITDDERVEMVWVPSSGTKYHSKSTCSGMKSPKEIPLEDAIKEGYTACKRCH